MIVLQRSNAKLHTSVANKSHRSRFVRGTIAAIEPVGVQSYNGANAVLGSLTMVMV